jgi:general secretion pathway protein D
VGNTFEDFLSLWAGPFQGTGGLVTSLFNASETVTLPNGVEVPTQAAIFTALTQSSNVNVLSAPHVLTSDNEEAEIVVGENVPFVTSSEQVSATGGVLTNVVREHVGITLRIRPQITTSDYINLEIYEEISALIPSPVGQDPDIVGPTTSESNVTVRDGQTIVIGGLLEDRATASQTRTPCLGSVPLAGYLFRTESESIDKTNLVIFITPHIMRTEADLERVRQETEEGRQEFLDRLESGDLPIPSEESPQESTEVKP